MLRRILARVIYLCGLCRTDICGALDKHFKKLEVFTDNLNAIKGSIRRLVVRVVELILIVIVVIIIVL
jgi:hypothetical protein